MSSLRFCSARRGAVPLALVRKNPYSLRLIKFGGGEEFRVPRLLVDGLAARKQGLPIREYGYGSQTARSIQVPCTRPYLGRGIPQLGGIDAFGFVVGKRVYCDKASRDQHHASLEHRATISSAVARPAFQGEQAGRRVIERDVGVGCGTAGITARNKHLAAREAENERIRPKTPVLPVALQVPLEGSYNWEGVLLVRSMASTLPSSNSAAFGPATGLVGLPVTVQVPVAGLYNSALVPCTASTWPLVRSVRLKFERAVFMLPVAVQTPVDG